MSGIILSDMTRCWNRDPLASGLGRADDGVSAALWSHGTESCDDVSSSIAFDHHIISIQQASYYAEVFKDGRHSFSGRLPKGSAQIMPAGVAPRAIQHGRWRVLHFYLPASLPGSLAAEEGLPSDIHLVRPAGKMDPVLDRIAASALAEMAGSLPLSRLRIDLLGQELALQLLRTWSNLSGTPKTKNIERQAGLAPWKEKRVRERLADCLAEDVQLRALAEECGLSLSHFARAFKASTGVPPHRYLIQLRIDKAKELLERTALPITEIAAKVGYDDPGYFARLFAKEVGVPPSRYRREHKQ